MTDIEYYGSFEDDWFEHRKKLQKIEEELWQNCAGYRKKNKDFSGNDIEDEDYNIWSESY